VQHATPLCLLLLPSKLETFILRDQAEDLLRAGGVVAVEPPAVPYGAFLRLPRWLGSMIARRQARRLVKSLDKRGAVPRTVLIFHPVQYPLAAAIARAKPGECELWYWRWDRYEYAYDASPRRRRLLADLNERAAAESTLVVVASEELSRLEREAGREPALVPLAADSFPAPDPSGAVVAVSLGHLGWRVDWTLLREVCLRMPELVLLLVGAWHDDECNDEEAYAWCRAHPGCVWLGGLDDEQAARVILCADVGIVPFKHEPFNDAALPYRIIKYARLGRRTVAPELAGLRTWANAVSTAADADGWVEALRAELGRRSNPDLELREWALGQTARRQNAPIWERLRELGISA
jgi:hypothetical protein